MKLISNVPIQILTSFNYRIYKRALPRVARHNARSHIPGFLKGRMQENHIYQCAVEKNTDKVQRRKY